MDKRILFALVLFGITTCVGITVSEGGGSSSVDGATSSIDSDMTTWVSAGGEFKLSADSSFSTAITIEKDSTLDLNGFLLEFTGTKDAITVSEGVTLTIRDGSAGATGKFSTSAKAYLVTVDGTLNLESGILVSELSSNARGVYSSGGTINMTGGTITTDGTLHSKGLFRLWMGAIANISGGLISSNNTGGSNPLLFNSGSTMYISGTARIETNSVCAIRTDYSYGDDLLEISGGTIKGLIEARNYDLSITGGDLSGASVKTSVAETRVFVSDDVVGLEDRITTSATGMMIDKTYDSSGGITTYYCLVDPEKAQVKIGEVFYPEYSKAVEASKDGDTVTLLKNVSSSVSITADITIDLNGKTVSNKITAKDGAIILITDNSVDGGGMLKGGNGNSYSCIVVEPGATVTVDEGVLVTNGKGTYTNPAIMVGEFEESSDKIATLHVYGTVENTASHIAISGNGNDIIGGTSINIYDGAEIRSNTLAIYHPQTGTLSVEGGVITGGTGIGMKSGLLDISGGTISGTAEKYVPTPGAASGIFISGAAIQLESNAGYSGDITVNISGDPVIGSTYCYALYEYQNSDDTTEVKAAIISGGYFTSVEGDADISKSLMFTTQAGANVEVRGGTFNFIPDYVITGLDIDEVAEGFTVRSPAPTVSLDTGAFTGSKTVTATVSGDSKIYYTTGAAEPSANSTLFPEGGLTVDATVTINLVAILDGCAPSEVVSRTYTVTCVDPTIVIQETPKEGDTYSDKATVSFTGDKVYYTLDGTDPSASNGKLYDGTSLILTKGCTIKAINLKDGCNPSAIVSKTITITTEVVEGDTTITTESKTEIVGGVESQVTTTTVTSPEGVTESTTVVSPGVTTTTVATTPAGSSETETVIKAEITSKDSLGDAIGLVGALGAGNATSTTIVINPSDSEKAETTITPAEAQAVAGAGAGIAITDNTGLTMEIHPDVLQNIPDTVTEIGFSIIEQDHSDLLPAQQDVVDENRLVFKLEMTLDGQVTSDIKGTATITIPFALNGGDPDDITVYLVHDDGEIERIVPIHYDAATETVSFERTSFSDYTVGFGTISEPIVPPIFIPLPDDDDFIPPMQAVKEDSKTTEIACIAAGAVAAMLAAILVAISRGRL